MNTAQHTFDTDLRAEAEMFAQKSRLSWAQRKRQDRDKVRTFFWASFIIAVGIVACFLTMQTLCCSA